MVRNKALVALAAVGLASTAGSAGAQNLYGSDTLKNVTVQALADCADGTKNSGPLLTPGNPVYQGTGSGQGGKAMGPGDSTAVPVIVPLSQQLAPMSRFLNATECSAIATNAGDGIVIGLDGITVGASNVGNNCDVLKYTGAPITVAPGYSFTDWRDVLRVIYTGNLQKLTGAGTSADGCDLSDPSATPSAAANITDATFDNGPPSPPLGVIADTRGVATNTSTATRCDNPVRKAMVSSWPAMFKDTCTNSTCTALRHLWRRDDASGTTDTFTTLLGLPKVTARTFCNGFETEDLDPIRTACDANEDVCATIPYANRNTNPNGAAPATSTSAGVRIGQVATNPATKASDLGLVVAITLPVDTTKQYGTVNCTFGKFAYAAMPPAGPLEAQRCPDGLARIGNKCKAPYNGTQPPPVGKFNCIAATTTVPSPRTWTNMDGRAYNLIPRDPDTGNPLLTGTGIADPRWAGGGAYRIHQVHKMANAAAAATVCTKSDATDLIGCLIGADPCSMGYAGQELLAQPATKGLKLRTPAVTSPQDEIGTTLGDSTDILKLLDACPDVGTRYALSRKLYINASKGLANVNNGPTAGGVNDEQKFLQCVETRANHIIDNAITANHFIAIPASFASYPTRTCPP